MIVLDTHIWLWWVNNDVNSLGSLRKELIDTADAAAVSAISCFEVAWLARHGRIALPCDRLLWFEKALEGSGIVLLPVTPKISCMAVDLPEHHKDPQDRLIIATALAHTARLMSADTKFQLYEEIATLLL
ncbi:MAG: type II toxin-antitoxin system VapC family toxin [Desulfatiglandaceae bacterium]